MHVKRDVLLEVFQSQHCLGFSASLKALNSECVTKKKKSELYFTSLELLGVDPCISQCS